MPEKGRVTVNLFGERLRELRERANLTQSQLAEKSGLNLSTVTRLEQGFREPTLTSARALADAIGVTCDELSRPPDKKPVKKPRGRPKKAD
ncbi:MAG: helix-turn-helix transcriptional regulator [Planctomycetia bacterium]|nr:helix-turn-helix transcriptional regulator [Planctomycetia bacterium]